MSVYYYEPFYNFDRLLDAFGSRPIGQQLTAPNDPTTSVFRPK